MKDDLSRILESWNPRVASAAEVRRGVWRRIAGSEPASGAGLRDRIEAAFEYLARPALASVLVASALALGMWLGTDASASAQRRAYLSSVNPYSHQP